MRLLQQTLRLVLRSLSALRPQGANRNYPPATYTPVNCLGCIILSYIL